MAGSGAGAAELEIIRGESRVELRRYGPHLRPISPRKRRLFVKVSCIVRLVIDRYANNQCM